MKKIFIEGDNRNPTVNFSAEDGIMEISGRSTTENSIAFFQPLYDWVHEYTCNPATETTVNIKLEYFNTSTSRWIFKILKKLESSSDKFQKLQVNWHYSDEDILDAGEDLKAIINVPFNMVRED